MNEKYDKNNDIVKIGGDYLIEIVNESSDSVRSIKFGHFNNILIIDYDSIFKSIVSVECIYSEEIFEDHYELPKHHELIKKDTAILSIDPNEYDELRMLYFLLIYDKKKLNIVFKNKDDIASYYTNGRVDYYFDNNGYICGITVNDLTEEEYGILKNEELNPGYYLNYSNRKPR